MSCVGETHMNLMQNQVQGRFRVLTKLKSQQLLWLYYYRQGMLDWQKSMFRAILLRFGIYLLSVSFVVCSFIWELILFLWKTSAGITTRSKAKSAPDQWTVMPLPAKVLLSFVHISWYNFWMHDGSNHKYIWKNESVVIHGKELCCRRTIFSSFIMLWMFLIEWLSWMDCWTWKSLTSLLLLGNRYLPYWRICWLRFKNKWPLAMMRYLLLLSFIFLSWFPTGLERNPLNFGHHRIVTGKKFKQRMWRQTKIWYFLLVLHHLEDHHMNNLKQWQKYSMRLVKRILDFLVPISFYVFMVFCITNWTPIYSWSLRTKMTGMKMTY